MAFCWLVVQLPEELHYLHQFSLSLMVASADVEIFPVPKLVDGVNPLLMLQHGTLLLLAAFL